MTPKFRQRYISASWSHQFQELLQYEVTIPENDDNGDVNTAMLPVPFRSVVEQVNYRNPTGLTEHAANYAVISIQNTNADEVCAGWSTETGEEGTLGAGTEVELTLGAEADRIIEAGEALQANVTETGTTTVPAGSAEVYLRCVPDDIAFKVFKAAKQLRVDAVDLKLLNGIAVSDTNYYVFTLKNGATTVATWSTKTTGGDGALTADTFAAMVLSATEANLVLDAGDVLTLDCAETGDALLSDIELVIHGRYL